MTTPSDDEISLSGVLSETRRIIKENSNHFSILYLLFLLPMTFLLFIYITIFPIGPQSNSTFATAPNFTFLQILYILVSYVFSISATGTMTYSAYNGYYNRPLELIPTLKSLLSSFIPLGSTLIVLHLISSSIGFLIGTLGFVMYRWLESFNLTIILVVIISFVCVAWIQMNWVLSNVIVLVESKWGYEPLRRSAYLMKGMKRIALKMTMLFGALNYVILFGYYSNSSKAGTYVVLQLFLGSFVIAVVMEYSLVAMVVLYIYCMKNHGELATEIQPQEYVSLLIDNDGNKYVAADVHA